MANNHEQFKAFHDAIKATSTRRKTLKKNRDALRDKIKKYFKDNHSDYIQPFIGRGHMLCTRYLTQLRTKMA